MATVEQRDTQPSVLSVLSLDLFNDFKDDKDSDEESFHLPLLDCDDDLDSNNKETVSNTTEKDVQIGETPGETEDEILNKFETTVTPDIDPKIEDKLLDDIDEVCEKKSDENCVDKSHETTSQDLPDNAKSSEKPSTPESYKEGDISEIIAPLTPTIPDHLNEESETKNDDLDEKEAKVENVAADENLIECDNKIKENTEETNSKETDNVELTQNNKIKAEKINSDPDIEGVDKIEDKTKNNKNAISSAISNSVDEEIKDEIVEASNTPKELLTDSIKADQQAKDETIVEHNVAENDQQLQKDSDKMEIDDAKMITDDTVGAENQASEILNDSMEVKNDNKDIADVSTLKTQPEHMDVEVSKSETKDDKEELCENKDIKKYNSEENVDNLVKESPPCSGIEEKELGNKEDSIKPCVETSNNVSGQNEIRQSEDTDQSVKPKEVVCSVSEKMTQESCENSNDSNKNDCEDDLLDISIIRDVDEDNASAIAENANDNHSSEKSDNDDQDEGSEKAENELDESEMEQDESLLTIDKDERMDFEDGNSSNLGYHDNTIISGNNSDSEAKDDETKDSEKESNITVLKETTNRTSDILDSDKNVTNGSLLTETKDTDSQAVGLDDQDSRKENSIKVGGKRSLNEANVNNVANKKIKLSDGVVTNEKKKSKKIKTLVTFEKFMQTKKIANKLTRSDLEQFCLQKICEAIVHKTDVGELHQTIKKQEQIIENLRKDLQQLTKQTRDLDIVNKKLMNELRAQNGIKKPLVPLKITRSVGLQVKLNVGTENSGRRKAPVAVNARTPNANNSPRQGQRPAVTPNANVVRQIATSPRKAPTNTPILSQALQTNRQTTPAAPAPKRPPVRAKLVEPQKPAAPGVIDLTDEDDKTSKSTTAPTLKIMNKAVPLTQTKTLNIIQNKAIPTKTLNATQTKTVAIGQMKTTTVGQKVGTPTRTVTTLPQGVRLTPTQVKNGSIAIPTSVVTSSAGTTQLMYVVQPTSSLGQVVTTTAGGTQKAVLLNFQSANGVLTSTLNGSAVSVIPTKTTNTVQLKTVPALRKHPAPLPLPPPVASNGSLKPLLPKPHLSIKKTETGIILQWRMPYNLDIYEGIASYQLFAYQETNAAPSTDMWRKVGDVKALALPMACTLTQFADKNKYYFAVRSVDVHKRIGAFSDPEEISL